MKAGRSWRSLSVYARTLLLLAAVLVAADAVCFIFLGHTPSSPPPERPPQGFEPGHPPPRPPGDMGPPESRAHGPREPMGERMDTRHTLYIAALELLVVLPLGWLFAAGIATPLRRFAGSAKAAGRDTVPAPLLREGPAEMMAAIDAFNAMQARLHRAVSERTQMVGAIAHDLRTPLTRLAFRLDDLPGPLGERVRDDIEEMKTMIAAALDFIRDRSSRGPAQRLDLRALVERVVEEQSDLGHDVSLAPGPNLTVEGDPVDLRRAVANLIENAIKYGHRARVTLADRGSDCSLEVDDDGPGIPEELQAQVFDPFFRIEASRNRETGGIGLGLSTVRAIVLEHGGEIFLGNRKGGGLKVTVRLTKSTA